MYLVVVAWQSADGTFSREIVQTATRTVEDVTVDPAFFEEI